MTTRQPTGRRTGLQRPHPEVPRAERCTSHNCFARATHLAWWRYAPEEKVRVCVEHANDVRRAGGQMGFLG